MRAVCKVVFYDGTGLHRPGDIVEVDRLSGFVEPVENSSEVNGAAEVPTKKASRKGSRKPEGVVVE